MLITAFIGWSGCGKTTLVLKVIAELSKRGYRVGAAKFTHHDIRLDTPGTDSARMRKAGAEQVLLRGPEETALFLDTIEVSEDAFRHLFVGYDIVIVEGLQADWPVTFEIASGDNAYSRLKSNPVELCGLITDEATVRKEAESDGVTTYPRSDPSPVVERLVELINAL